MVDRVEAQAPGALLLAVLAPALLVKVTTVGQHQPPEKVVAVVEARDSQASLQLPLDQKLEMVVRDYRIISLEM